MGSWLFSTCCSGHLPSLSVLPVFLSCRTCCLLSFIFLLPSQLCQMACAVRMHLDHTTFERLQSAYSYFPKPYANHLAKGSFTGKDGLGPSTAQQTGSSSSDGMAAAGAVNTSGSISSSSSSSSVRAGAILEAPAASSVPSISATGGASSVSVGSMSGAMLARQPGAKVTHTTQTNVWLPLRDATSSSSRLQAAQTQQAGVERSSSGGDASTVNAPDAAA